ncbi:hypothetical protein [Siphonobacter sp. BAB-5385]|uniref:hypothetical protein n=1 Tax=Siphonobacter sp. BAB-5385 TaxID=1864822 RepID=UPI0015961EC4|nr:hypothetical protein [Siphonobacter sp. BAB-5385]
MKKTLIGILSLMTVACLAQSPNKLSKAEKKQVLNYYSTEKRPTAGIRIMVRVLVPPGK